MRSDLKVRWSLGGFYGSAQLRGDRDVVKAAAARVARSKGIKCLIGPEINGWVGVYPENNGQDQTIGEEIARDLGGEAIHLIVHDDDIFAYWYWRNGELIDSYWSRPGYFGEEQRAEQEAMRGRAEVFEHIVRDGLDKLKALLERKEGRFIFEMERLEQFAKLLGISNAVTAFEYLKAGETEGVRKWKQFVEVPDDEIQAARAAKRDRENRIKAEKRRLKAEGLLLYEESRKSVIPRACRAGEGFMVGWQGLNPKNGELVQWHAPPWRKGRAVDVEVTRSVNGVTSTPDGKTVIIAIDDGAMIWRSEEPAMALGRIANVEWVIEAALSHDGRRLVHSDREGIHVTEVSNGERVATFGFPGTRVGVLHPKGQWLVLGRMGICLVEVRSDAAIRELNVGAKSRLAEALVNASARALKAINVDATVEQWKRSMEVGIEQTLKWAMKGKQQLSPEQIAALRANMERGLEHYRERLVEAKEARSPIPVLGNETGCLCFSRDGERLWCGTDKGLRGYLWADLLTARGDEVPIPRWRFDPEPVSYTCTSYVYAIAEEAEGRGVVFAGYDGKVRRMELASGDVREILSVPDGGAVVGMCLSRDEAAMGVITRPGFWEVPKGRDERSIWQIWDYAKLVAGL